MTRPGMAPGSARIRPEEAEQLRQCVSDLRRELARRFGDRAGSASRRPAAGDPSREHPPRLPAPPGPGLGELILGLRQALSRLGQWRMRDWPGAGVDDFGFDPRGLEEMRGILDFLHDRWWRVQVIGAEHAALDGRVMLVANCSGVLPWDGLMIAHAVEHVDPAGRRPRFLVGDPVATLPFAGPLLARLGGVRACRENAERLLGQGQHIVVFPEGWKGALKPFHARYRLQRFGRGGFVALALRLDAILVPVAVVGAEEAHPVLFRPRRAGPLRGLPFPVTPTFPWLGPLGLVPLPSRWRIRFGAPIRWTDSMRARAEDSLFVSHTRERVRATIQSLLREELRRRAGVFR